MDWEGREGAGQQPYLAHPVLVPVASDFSYRAHFPHSEDGEPLLCINRSLVVGRGSQLHVTDKRVSRQQVELEPRLGPPTKVVVTLRGVNPSVVHHCSGGSVVKETILARKGDTAEMLIGDVLCLLAGDHCFRLQAARSTPAATSERPPREPFIVDEGGGGEGDERGRKRSSPLKRVKAEEGAQEETEAERRSPDDNTKRRRRASETRPAGDDRHDGGSRLVPLEFEFGENGATVKVLDLTTETAASPEEDLSAAAVGQVSSVLPHLDQDAIRRVLRKLGGNAEAAIDVLLGVEDDDDDGVVVVVDSNDKASLKKDATDDPLRVDGEEELAGELVSSNTFPEAEPFFHLNWLPKFPASANEGALRIREIIPENVERAVIVTYQVDMDWLMRRCPVLTRVPWSLIHGERHVGVLPHPPPPNVHYHKPRLLEYGCHHGKMMLLFWKDTLRVAITTANLIQKDYERKTQGIWLQDFPKKKKKGGTTGGSPLAQDFEDTLVDYINHMGNETQLHFRSSLLRQYDYSAVRVALVTSVPGYHLRGSLNSYGHMRLRHLLSKEAIPDDVERQSSLGCQFSSVGSLSANWVIEEFGRSLMACAGHHGDTKKGKKKEADVELVWPTVDYVRNSIDGYPAGGSLCFGSSNRRDFMTPLFRQYKAMQEGRGRVTPHIKCFVRHRDSHLAWVCLTSANLSKAAWGALQKGDSQLMIRNFEIGVLFLPSHFNNRTFVAGSAPSLLSSDTVVMPLPYRIEPLERYGSDDRPWIWDLPYPEPDTHGTTWGL